MSEENQSPAALIKAANVKRREQGKPALRLPGKKAMQEAERKMGLTNLGRMEWGALAILGKGINHLGDHDVGTGLIAAGAKELDAALQAVKRRMEDKEDPPSEERMRDLERLRMELSMELVSAGNKLANERARSPSAEEREVTKSFPVHSPVQVNISTQPVNDVKVISHGSHLGTESETEQS